MDENSGLQDEEKDENWGLQDEVFRMRTGVYRMKRRMQDWGLQDEEKDARLGFIR